MINEQLEELNKSIEKTPDNAALYMTRAKLLFDLEEYEDCIKDCDFVINNGTTDQAMAYAQKAHAYYRIDKIDEAYKCAKISIELDDKCYLGYFILGNYYYDTEKDYHKALIYYSKVIEINPEYVGAYNNRAVLLKIFNKYDDALSDYNKAIELNPDYALAYNNRASLYLKYFKLYDKALDDYKKAHKLSNNNSYMHMRAERGIKEAERLIADTVIDENIRLNAIMKKIDDLKMNQQVKEAKKSFKDFLVEGPIKTNETERFVVLRRWNSYTPIIASDRRISKGGGYFFKLDVGGVVIDPGFNFIDNFKAQGFKFYEIDHIFITHAHNDHTTDLESILTLLHQYNENILGEFDNPEEGTIMYEVLNESVEEITEADRDYYTEKAKERLLESKRRKRIKLYMSASTYSKYAPMLELHKKAEYDVVLIKEDDSVPLESSEGEGEGKKLVVTAISAKHNDVLSDKYSLGFIIEYNDFIVVYTGDTGYSSEIGDKYKKIKKKYYKKQIILLAHLGGFKEYEENYDYGKPAIDKDNQKKFYKNHLGRLGLAKLVEILKPSVCIVSEFGEEFRKIRTKFTAVYQEIYPETIFIPADIGLCIRVDNKIELINRVDIDNHSVDTDYYDIKDVSVLECKTDASLHYYKADEVEDTELLEYLINKYK